MRRVAIVGAGYISAVHADALAAIPEVTLAAVVDQNREAAERLAKRHRVASVFTDVEALITSKCVDAAHVAVPPPLHRAIAEPLLRAGIDVLLEKPLAASSSDAEALAAIEGGGRLGVNQNFVHHPAFLQLKRALPRIGPVEHVHVQYNVPLRQMVARQFGHWMFATPGNILLEQAVHPLSQVLDLIGPVKEFSVASGPEVSIGHGKMFRPIWQMQLRGHTAGADLQFAVGRDFPFWRIEVVGTDGVIDADILNNRTVILARSRYPDFADTAISGLSVATQTAGQGLASLCRYAGSLVKIIGRSDPFFLSMKNTIAAFHQGYPTGTPKLDGRFGADLVSLCERMAAAADRVTEVKAPLSGVAPASEERGDTDVALLGGTGFIGGHLLRLLSERGLKVSVLARNIGSLPAEYHQPNVTLIRGDVHEPLDIRRGIGSAKLVVNLAQGAGGSSEDEIVANIKAAATRVAECCVELGVRRLVHLSTIAALHLGNSGTPVTAATPIDPRLALRAVYARGKALAEAATFEKAAGTALEVVVLRPGVVVGAGGLPFHSGVGFFNNEQHCLGWDDGRHPLPFVLADDVAAATVAALTASNLSGRTLNLIGDVRLSAREYIAELGRAMRRPLRFHGNAPWKLAFLEAGKWALKRAAGRRDAVRPTYWDIKSRGLSAPFDTTIEKELLGWKPEADRRAFIERAIKPFER